MIDNLRKIWRIIKRYPHVVDKKMQCIELGSEYGSFGVVADYMEDGMKVLSFGVGEDVSFDMELIKKYGAYVYAFDPTPKVIDWVKKNNLETDNFKFYPVGIAKENGKVLFHLPVNENHISGSMIGHDGVSGRTVEVEMCDFKHICDMIDVNNINLLKMDIEGAEFDVLPDIMECLEKINICQICLEWHGRFYKNGRKKIKEMCSLLRSKGYVLAYISDDGSTNSFVKIR